MKQNLPKVLSSLFLTLTLTVIFLFVTVLAVIGSNNAFSFYSVNPSIHVSQTSNKIVQTGILKNLSGEKSYRVQVCALRSKVNDITVLEKACGQSTLIVEEVDGYYKYLTSSLTVYSEVLNSLKELKSKPGFEGSFIVSYQNGIRIKPLHYAKNNLIPLSVKHVVVVSAISKPIEVITSTPAVASIKKNKEHNTTTDTKQPVQVLKEFTNQYIPSKMLLFVSIFFGSCFLLLVLLLVISYLIKNKKLRDSLSLRELYAEELAKYWFDPSEKSQVSELFKEANNGFRKDLLISEMIAMLNTLSETSGNKIRELYYKLQLDFYSFEKLHNRKWNIRAMGIHELAAFNAFNEADSIEEFINHPHPILRREAITAIVRLRPSDPLGFLDRLRVPFTKRDQLNAIAVLKKHHLNVPDFSRWFDSYDPVVVVFAVEMVCQFRQIEASNNFDKLLHHSCEEVRLSVIKAIGDMYLREYSSRLISIFNDEHENIQLLILQTMGKLEDLSVLNFLSDLVLLNSSMKIRMEAANALINIGSQGLTRMQTLLLKQDSDISYIYHQLIG